MSVPDHPAGLCSICRHRRVTANRRGSTFWLCRRSETDPRFPRYPRLPMIRCPGFEPGDDARAHRAEPTEDER